MLICRNEHFIRAHIYLCTNWNAHLRFFRSLPGSAVHFSIDLIGNQIAGSVSWSGWTAERIVVAQIAEFG